MEIHVGGNFRMGSKFASGSFGDIYIGTNLQTEEEVAIKLEPIKSKNPVLLYEAKLYKLLAGGVGVPHVHWYGVEGDHYVMVIDLLGPSLEDVFDFCNRAFSLKTILMLADQMVKRVEYVHVKSLVHRDLKPENFLIGLGANSNQVHLIDFGLAKTYRNRKTLQHIEYREKRGFIGTPLFASVNAHFGVEQSRRDDLEALGYTLVYLARGRLPWEGLEASTMKHKCEKIVSMKQVTPVEVICKDCPSELAAYLQYCRGLKFESSPDYAYIRTLLKDVFLREGFKYDFVFDWTTFSCWQQDEDRIDSQRDETWAMPKTLSI